MKTINFIDFFLLIFTALTCYCLVFLFISFCCLDWEYVASFFLASTFFGTLALMAFMESEYK